MGVLVDNTDRIIAARDAMEKMYNEQYALARMATDPVDKAAAQERARAADALWSVLISSRASNHGAMLEALTVLAQAAGVTA